MTGVCACRGSGEIEALFYGDPAPLERSALEAHVRACADCQSLLEDLALIRDALAARPTPSAPAGGDWTPFMTRLDRALARDAGSASMDVPAPAPALALAWPAAPARARAGGTDVAMPRRWSRRSVLAAAAVLALATLGTLSALRAIRSLPPPDAYAAATPPNGAAASEERAFEAVTEEHFERSKLVVLGLASKDPARTDASGWGYERDMAGRLLGDTRMYRMAAEDRGLGSIAAVMRDLELVLLEASFTDDRDPASLAHIQRLIRRRDLVEKLDAVGVTGL